MNSEQPSREQIEARITALLLGELPPAEAELLRWMIAQDASLQKLHDELKSTIVLVRAAVKPATVATAEKVAPLQFSDERRQKLLAHLKTPRPQPSIWLRPIVQVPRLVTALALVAIVALLAAMLLPALSKSKSKSMRARAMLSAPVRQMEYLSMDKNSAADVAPAPAPPAVMTVTVAPEAALAPPPAPIVLPQAESASDLAAQTTAPAKSDSGGVYSQHIVGYVNVAKENPANLQDNFGLSSPAPAKPLVGGAAVLGDQVEFDDGKRLAGRSETLQRNTFTTEEQRLPGVSSAASEDAAYERQLIEAQHQREQRKLENTQRPEGYLVSKPESTPAAAEQTGLPTEARNGGNQQNNGAVIGVVNAFAGTGDFRNSVAAGGGGGFGGFGGGATLLPQAGISGAKVESNLGIESAAASPAPGSVAMAWNDSGVNRSASDNLSANTWGLASNADAQQLASGLRSKAPGQNAAFFSTLDGSEGRGEVRHQAILPAAGALSDVAVADKDLPEVTLNGVAGEPSAKRKLVEGKPVEEQAGRALAPVAAPLVAAPVQAKTTVTAGGSLALSDRGEATTRYRPARRSPVPAQPTDANKTPLLGDVPVAGRAFQSGLGDVVARIAPPPAATPAPVVLESANTFQAGNTITVGGNLALDDTKSSDRDQNVTVFKLNNAESQQTTEALQKIFQSDLSGRVQTPAQSSALQQRAQTTTAPAAGNYYLSAEKDAAGFNFVTTNAVAVNQTGGNNTFNPTVSAVSKGQLQELVRQKKVSLPEGILKQLDEPLPKPAAVAPVPQPEILTRENNFSTFSLNVSDVSFKLAAASLEKGQLPDAASIRSEEFINAFDYRDPEAKWDSASGLSAPAGVSPVSQPLAFAAERARDPFAHNRDLLRFSVKTAAAGRQAGRALNLVLLLDTSGSMERADRVAIIRKALRVLAAQLQPQDTVSVVTFARTARLWADGVPGDKAGETLSQVGGITPEGGTNLEEAMRLAYETARRHYLARGMNRVVLLTDGAANLGNVDPGALKQKVEAQRRQGIALDCFGIGWEDFNDDLLEQLSGNGDGRYAFINSPEDAANDFAAKLAGALQVAAQDVKVQVEFNPQRVISWRQIGYAKHQLTKEQFRDNSVIAAEIAAQEAGNALYTVETKPDGLGPIATVYVRYRVPGTQEVHERSWTVEYDGTAPALENSSAAMRLAAIAAAFSEWLAASPFAQEVSPDELLKSLSGVPQIYGADQRPAKLETMIREAKSVAGK